MDPDTTSLEGRRICFVVNVDWFFLSHRLPLAREARTRGAEVHVAAGSTGRGPTIEESGFKFHPLSLSRSGTNPVADLRTFLELLRLYWKVKPDLVHHVTLKPVIYGSLAARIVSKPGVVNALSGLGYVFARDRRGAILRNVVEYMLKRTLMVEQSMLIVQNQDDQERFAADGYLPADRVALIRGSGVDVNRFVFAEEPASPPYVVMLASRMLWDKGIKEFVEAASRIASSGVAERYRFVLVGAADAGNPSGVPESTLARWEQEGTVEWWGHREGMEDVLARAHVVVLPSYREGLPRILLEAAAVGRALVATDVPGCREVVVDGENGWLVPSGDATALARAIADLVSDDKRRRTMGRQGRRHVVENFSLSQVVRETFELYGRLLRNGKRYEPDV